MSRKEELEASISALRQELNAINEAEADALNAELVGKHFRTRNNYSMPKAEADYWWLYIRVDKAQDGGLSCTRFQDDKKGRIEFETNVYMPNWSFRSDYEEIERNVFDKAWQKAIGKLEALA